MFRPKDHRDELKEQRQKRPEMGEDLADVVAAGAEDGKDGIADAAFQRAPGKAAVGLHVPDLGLDGASPFEEPCQ